MGSALNSRCTTVVICRYRNQYSSDAMVQELASSQDCFAPPLLETQKKITAQVQNRAGVGARKGTGV